MMESLAGTLLGLIIFVVLLLIFREMVCWFLKINTLQASLDQVQRRLRQLELADSGGVWTVRIPDHLRPLKVSELRLTNTEMRSWIEKRNGDLKKAWICPPGEAEFVQFEKLEQLNAKLAEYEEEQSPKE